MSLPTTSVGRGSAPGVASAGGLAAWHSKPSSTVGIPMQHKERTSQSPPTSPLTGLMNSSTSSSPRRGLGTMPRPDRRYVSSAAIEVNDGGLISQTGEKEPLAMSLAMHRYRIGGTAEQLLLMLWGRVPVTAGVEVTGDVGALDRWSELIPPM